MEQIVITHGFVKKLAANIRSKLGRDIRHTEVLELVAGALGWKAGPLMHALKHSDAAKPQPPAHSDFEKPQDGLPQGLFGGTPHGYFDLGSIADDKRKLIDRFLEGHKNAGKYRDAGLDPMNKMFVMGAQALGVAGHLSESLRIPLFELPCDAIRSSGADGQSLLRKAFEDLTGKRGVLLIDDIDTICSNREFMEPGDLQRLASVVLAILDDVPKDLIVVAGTRHPGMVDRALLRRFNMRIDMRPEHLDPASVLLRPENDQLSSDQRRFVALVDRAHSRETVLLVAACYELHPEVSAARTFLRRRGWDWQAVRACRLEDLEAVHRKSLREG